VPSLATGDWRPATGSLPSGGKRVKKKERKGENKKDQVFSFGI
jgi:hypothetical protein